MFSAWDGGVRREAARFCSCLRLNKELFVNALWTTGTKKRGKEEIQHLKKPLGVHSWHRNKKYLSGLFGTASPSLSNHDRIYRHSCLDTVLTARSPHVKMGNLLPLIHCMVTSETYRQTLYHKVKPVTQKNGPEVQSLCQDGELSTGEGTFIVWFWTCINFVFRIINYVTMVSQN